MSIKYNIHENPFKRGKAFFAKTIINQKVNENKLRAYMAMKETSLTENQLQGVLNLLKESIKELLSEGNLVQLDNFLELYPSVTAGFDTPKDFFNHHRDQIKIRCRINKALTKEVKSKTLVEKQSDEERQPNLTHVISGIKQENVIRWPYSTTLRGSNLNPAARDINSISIFSQNDHNQILIVPANDLVLDSKGSKELSFSISNQVQIPAWLTPGLPVYLRIDYAGDNPLLNRQSTEVKTYWQELPQVQANDTEIIDQEEISA